MFAFPFKSMNAASQILALKTKPISYSKFYSILLHGADSAKSAARASCAPSLIVIQLFK